MNVNEHDTWFSAAPPLKGVVLLTHGLNGNPASLDSLARVLALDGFEVFRPAFTGHRKNNHDFLHVTAAQWEADAKRFYSTAWARAQALMVPLHHVAYSMSGLIYQSLRDELKFDRRVYFAPALAMKFWYPAAMWIVRWLPWVKFRSKIPRGYFANEQSGFRSAWALHEFWKKFSGTSDQVPTLILCDPRDELVLGEGLRTIAVAPWKFQEVSTDACTLPKRYHHLIIDEASLGSVEWKRVCGEVVKFLCAP